ncbi:LytTR family DNA-binding domain-containing protein [Arundinibacter roseus]|uniref:LytTR family transcriptional regulator n=1 Tax=Arundinibacter roseus TaxID=2070510 RepID=A0A4R4KC62_9BACT|nr:LytTR family DNA-binding domain-containing protein [Arundinibacter roseus]TDB64041.1 LytTR family transcriptional regulator [Arundinibacter roseus]
MHQPVKTLELNRSFLRKPLSGIAILFIIVVLYELLSWAITPETRLSFYNNSESFTSYLFNWLFGFYLPELVTLYILVILVNKFHTLFKINELTLSTKSILQYQASFLPLFLTAYFFFIPITLHLRFFLREFPEYDMLRYQQRYLVYFYTVEGYISYTPFVILLGYILLNTSLILDFLQNLRKVADPSDSVFSAFASFATGTPRTYTQLIEAKMSTGDTLLSVEDCYLFETVSGEYFVEHRTGRFTVSKSLAELENELDPQRFFRGNRNYILNLDFFDSYSYWEKGKYILYSRKLPGKQLIMPRARMQSFKEALESNRSAAPGPKVTLADPQGNS